ncbi:hypothetical protein chiPu_0029460, partial [Chiloscyllium punctatum]|nr:hypothetical protein [Chiloscyllium punctatum]
VRRDGGNRVELDLGSPGRGMALGCWCVPRGFPGPGDCLLLAGHGQRRSLLFPPLPPGSGFPQPSGSLPMSAMAIPNPDITSFRYRALPSPAPAEKRKGKGKGRKKMTKADIGAPSNFQ